MARAGKVAAVALVIMVSACVAQAPDRPRGGAAGAGHSAIAALPPMRWDHRPEAQAWTKAALAAVTARDAQLADRVPADIADWCPGYEAAGKDDRRAFWVGLLSALAKYESTWNPGASGGGGRYIGLLQISPKTAGNYGCKAQSAGALKDGAANLACGVRIFAGHVAADGVVAGGGKRGIGRDWGPFKKADMRGEMAAWTRAQPYCVKHK